MRRLLVFCAVAGAVLAAYAVAQNSSAALPSTTLATGLPANARVIANGIAVRALAANPGAASNGDSAGVLELTVANSPNRVFALAIPAITSLPAVTSKRDSSTACPGASRNTNSAGHSARNDNLPAAQMTGDGGAGCAANVATAMAVVAGVGQAGSLGDGGAATSAQLDLAADSLVERSGIAVAPNGTIFIADTQNSTIRSVGAAASSEPGVIRSVAGRWAARQNIALGQPMGIAADRAGNLYIADYSAGAVDVPKRGHGATFNFGAGDFAGEHRGDARRQRSFCGVSGNRRSVCDYREHRLDRVGERIYASGDDEFIDDRSVCQRGHERRKRGCQFNCCGWCASVSRGTGG